MRVYSFYSFIYANYFVKIDSYDGGGGGGGGGTGICDACDYPRADLCCREHFEIINILVGTQSDSILLEFSL